MLAKVFREDAKGATTDWVLLSAGILLPGAVALYAVFVGGTNALVSEMNRSFANAPSASAPDGTTVIQDAGRSDACAKRLEERPTGDALAECRSQVPLNE